MGLKTLRGVSQVTAHVVIKSSGSLEGTFNFSGVFVQVKQPVQTVVPRGTHQPDSVQKRHFEPTQVAIVAGVPDQFIPSERHLLNLGYCFLRRLGGLGPGGNSGVGAALPEQATRANGIRTPTKNNMIMTEA
jgi:hypothetical protein